MPGSDGGRSAVSFVVSSTQTRASVTPHEGNVTSLDVLVFRSNGALDAHARATAAGTQMVESVTTEVSGGMPLNWYVIANAPAGTFSSFSTEQSFLAAATLLTHGTTESLVMYGKGNLPDGPVSGSVRVSLTRYACKVTLERLTVDWSDAFTMASSVTLGRIVLVNVVGSTPWSGTPAAGDLWYNRMGVESGQASYVEDMTVRNYRALALQRGVAAEVASPLYCMPNPVSSDDNSETVPTWTPRKTRIAVEILLDGEANWYPIDLPVMSCNTHYLINSLTITGPGSNNPDKPVKRSDIRFTAQVVPWEDTTIPVPYQ